MSGSNGTSTVGFRERERPHIPLQRALAVPAYDAERFEQVGFLTAMTLTLLGNYAQTGHPSAGRWPTPRTTSPCTWRAPTPAGCATTTAAPSTRSRTASCSPAATTQLPTGYALWMIMGEALARRRAAHAAPCPEARLSL